MPDEAFVDTNILVYAHDLDAGEKHQRARRVLNDLWKADPLPWVSVQVLQELVVTLSRRAIAMDEIQAILWDYSRWRVVDNTVDVLEAALMDMERWRISLWDALVLSAARKAGAALVLSEDFQDGRDYDGVRAKNPLKDG